jgi:hypothetical protein
VSCVVDVVVVVVVVVVMCFDLLLVNVNVISLMSTCTVYVVAVVVVCCCCCCCLLLLFADDKTLICLPYCAVLYLASVLHIVREYTLSKTFIVNLLLIRHRPFLLLIIRPLTV